MSPRGAAAALLHLRETGERPWRGLPALLAVAFAARAAVALGGDFVLHPDEIMQYLEPAHRLVFGNGVVYWEYFYGARSWLVPGFVAAMLKAFDVVGLGEPAWYVAGVKLAFCAVSLTIPVGMYCFARGHFGERTARVALVAGALWYELVGFAHKPMAEFVATAALLPLLALAARPSSTARATCASAAVAAVLAAAVRPQYAPVAVALLAVVFVRTERKLALAAAVAGLAVAVGAFDAVVWDAGPFHSYLTNLRFNMELGPLRAGESPPWQFLTWLATASGGLALACLALAALRPRRYGLVLLLAALVLVAHALQAHKEYRFVFAAVPLWLLLGADLLARAAAAGAWRRAVAWACVAGAATAAAAGIANALPGQDGVYRAWSRETGGVRFLGDGDPVFAAYRYLARAPDVGAVWHPDRHYFALPGYYYLHRRVPFYDRATTAALVEDLPLDAQVTHIVMARDVAVPGYAVARQFGDLRVLRRERRDAPVRRWRDYAPTVVDGLTADLMRRVDPEVPAPPPGMGIRFHPRAP